MTLDSEDLPVAPLVAKLEAVEDSVVPGFVAALLLLFMPSSLRATTFSNRPLGAVVKEAAIIVRGKTGASAANWGKGDQKGSIFTYTDLEITEVLKGAGQGLERGHRITVKQPGGEKDGIEMSVAATAQFSPGEDVVLTLAAKEPDDAYMVLNFTAGKYGVVEENGQLMLVNSLGGGEVYDPGRGDAKAQSYNSRIPLEVFRKVIAGQAPEAAISPQFQPSDKPGPRTHKHDHGAEKRQPPAPAFASPGPAMEGNPKGPAAGGDWWIPLSFMAFVFSAGILFWALFIRGKGGE